MTDDFAALFGRLPDAVTTAPGRVNLMGEHTDYNDGLVLPTAIPQRTTVAVGRRGDDRVRVASRSIAERGTREFVLGAEAPVADWLDYVQGCTRALSAAAPIRGFDALITSSVPLGAGLASSAALEVALLRALRSAYSLALDDVTLARIAHRAEHDFVGAHVGIMDRMAASLASPSAALYLDARTLAYEAVRLPEALSLIVVDSGIAHRHAAGDYNQRRAECERAAAELGLSSLRAVGDQELGRISNLPPPLAARVRHVVTENGRVLAAVAALRGEDLPALGALFVASHASQRDDYSVSLPEVDALVEIAAAEPGVFGARLTGGGFGGAVVVAARAGDGRGVGARILEKYRRRTDADGRVLVAGT